MIRPDSSDPAARVRILAIRDEADRDDAEALARLFEDPGFGDDGSAAARLRTILDATERRSIKGLHTGLPFSDEGFRGDRAPGGSGLRDPWESSRNQVGHFLTAVGLAFRPETVAGPVLGVPMRAWLGASPAMSDEEVGKRLTVGHELAADPGVLQGLVVGGLAGAVGALATGFRGWSAAVMVPIGLVLGGAAGALGQQFLGFRDQFRRAGAADLAAFDRALIAAGPGPDLDIGAIETALGPLFAKIDVGARGNSYQDLRLSLLGWWLGAAVRRGTIVRGEAIAGWIRGHLAGSGDPRRPAGSSADR